MSNLTRCLIVLAVVIGVCLILYQITGNITAIPGKAIDVVGDVIANVFGSGDTEIIVLPPVIKQIQALSLLLTQEDFSETIVTATKERCVGGVCEEKLAMVVCGRVTAGVDLSKLLEADIQVDGRKAVVDLPDSEIFQVTIDEDSGCTYIYDWSVPPLMQRSLDLQDQVRSQARDQFEQNSLENGILERAQSQAEEEVAGLLLMAGFEVVEFSDTEHIETESGEN